MVNRAPGLRCTLHECRTSQKGRGTRENRQKKGLAKRDLGTGTMRLVGNKQLVALSFS
jgi:hypothetical protein